MDKDGQKIQTLAESKFAVRRPGEMRIDRVSPNGRVVFRDDGKQFSVYNSDKNIYATAPAPAKLDQAADDARASSSRSTRPASICSRATRTMR